MPITLNDDARAQAIASLQTYAERELETPLGNLAAGALLDFFLEEIGPAIYNQAVVAAQDHLAARVRDLDLELHEDEFPYWVRRAPKPKRR